MFRFRIQDVLWLTLAVALGAGWWVDRSQLGNWWDRRFARLGLEIQQAGFDIYEDDKGGYHIIERPPAPEPTEIIR